MKIKGIQFVTDASGKKTAVLIDLRKHGNLWEDFYDCLVALSRKQENRESMTSVKKRLQKSFCSPGGFSRFVGKNTGVSRRRICDIISNEILVNGTGLNEVL